MALNKQGPKKIAWTDYTWNPISGCMHGCDYCYMKRLEERFKSGLMTPALHPSRYDDPKGLVKPSMIFTGSSGDMWGEWVPDSWIKIVLEIVEKYHQHTFQFLTKNPKRYVEYNDKTNYSLPQNAIYGMTIDGTEKTNKNALQLPQMIMQELETFISFEPLLQPIAACEMIEMIVYTDWIIIGANSNPGAEKPPLHWAGMIIAVAKEYGVPVFVKDNYNYPDQIKEFPNG